MRGAASDHDPFGRARMPPDLVERHAAEAAAEAAQAAALEQAERERAQRAAWLLEAAEALLAGTKPGAEAAAFVGGLLLARLHGAGDLEQLARIRPRRGSHRTPGRLLEDLRSSSR